MTSLIVASFLSLAVFVVGFAASLQFLGLGNSSELMWGTMLYNAQQAAALEAGNAWWALAPGAAVALMGAGFALVNYAFDEIGNPALRPVGGSDVPDPLLEVDDLIVDYTTDAGETRAVDRVSFTLAAGEFLGIVGESGCGKSTLLFAVAQLLSPPGEVVGGRVMFHGQDMVRLSDGELRNMRWRDYSVVMQSAMNALNPMKSIGAQFKDTIQAHGGASAEDIRRARPRCCAWSASMRPISTAIRIS